MHLTAAFALIVSVFALESESFQRADRSFDFNGRHIVGITGKSATVWDVRTGAVVHRITAHAEAIKSVQLSPSGSTVLTSSYKPLGEQAVPSKDNSIRLWDVASGKQRLFLRDATVGQFSRDGKRIFGFVKRGSHRLSASFDLAVWDVRTGVKLFTIALPGQGASPEYHFTLQESARSDRLLFFQSSQARVYNLRAGKALTETIDLSRNGDGYGFMEPGGDEIQLASSDYLSFFTLTESKEAKRVPFPKEYAGFGKMAWSRDGSVVARASLTGQIMIVNRKAGHVVSTVVRIELPSVVLMAPDGVQFVVYASGSHNQSPRTVGFDTTTGKTLWTLNGRVIGVQGSEFVLVCGSKLTLAQAASGKVRTLCTLANAPEW